MPSLFKDEVEFYTVLSKLIVQRVKSLSQNNVTTLGIETSIRLCIENSMVELIDSGLITVDAKIPPASLVKLVDIDLQEISPKINIWPLVIVLFPMAKLRNINPYGNKIMDSDGDSLTEPTNGRFIDLS